MVTESHTLVAVDWGTSTLRTYLLNEHGSVNAFTSAARGILHVAGDRFEQVLAAELEKVGAPSGLPIICSGMITSRQGWVETPYVPCPAGAEQLANNMVEHDSILLGTIHFIPGVKQCKPEPDVMRGEETQVVGLDHNDGLCLLPGTHSKWVTLENGRISGFTTYMTGDLYAALGRETILRASSRENWSDHDFLAGVYRAREDFSREASLLSSLFRTRARKLLGVEDAAGSRSYLSGLLIGSEICDAQKHHALEEPLTVIGDEELVNRYRRALDELGVPTRSAPAHSAARGIFRIAMEKGLIG